MKLSRPVRIGLTGAGIGLAFGVAFSGSSLISAEVWASAAAVTVVAVLVRDLLVASRVEGFRIIPALSFAEEEETNDEPRGLQNTRSLVASATSNHRAFNKNLKPHLVDLAEHHMPRRHGFSPSRNPERAAEYLGDLSWLIDPAPADKAPTNDELNRFFDIVVGDDEILMLTTQPNGASPK